MTPNSNTTTIPTHLGAMVYAIHGKRSRLTTLINRLTLIAITVTNDNAAYDAIPMANIFISKAKYLLCPVNVLEKYIR